MAHQLMQKYYPAREYGQKPFSPKEVLTAKIMNAHKRSGLTISIEDADSEAACLFDELSEIPNLWLVAAYEHARIHRRAIPRTMEILKSWDSDIKQECFRKDPPKALISAPIQEPSYLWADLAAHRLLTTRSRVKDAPGVCEPCNWILDTVKLPPTELEKKGFLRMFTRVKYSDLTELAEYWGNSNPYGYSKDQILRAVEDAMSA